LLGGKVSFGGAAHELIAQTATELPRRLMSKSQNETDETRELQAASDLELGLAIGFGSSETPGASPKKAPMTEPGALINEKYKLIQAIGEGGMGSVWLAEQKVPVKRKVALKFVKAGMDSRSVLARFEAERQALAMMDHPSIAKVLDGGMTEQSRPYFVMELVKGIPLTDYCDQVQFSIRERLELFGQVCSAVQHAHQKGIIHRDLKPSNVLVTEVDGRPVVKVIDFGLAKALRGSQVLTDQSLHTAFGAVLGTPLYMAPEQLGTSALDVDTRADLYSLGVILYELLTGTTPIERNQLKAAAFDEMCRLIREEEPPRPSTRLSSSDTLPNLAARRHTEPAKLGRIVRGELDWIVMKALEKDRNRRYETAVGLGRDIERYLDGEAVEACPPNTWYRLSKLLKRNRQVVVVTSMMLGVVLASLLTVIYIQVHANRNLRLLNLSLDQANTELQAKNSQIEQQRKQVAEREQEAIQAIDGFADAVSNNSELKHNAELANLRQLLLSRPLQFFNNLRQRLQTDQTANPDSLTQLATVGTRLGMLASEIGDKQLALRAYQDSMAALESQLANHPTDDELQYRLAKAQANIGNVLLALEKPHEAILEFEAALNRYRPLNERNPADTEVQHSLAMSLSGLAGCFSRIEDRAKAIQTMEAALDVQSQLVSAHPNQMSWQSAQALILNNLGHALFNNDQLPAARLRFSEALKIREALVAEYPAEEDYRKALANSLSGIGLVLNKEREVNEAISNFQRAVSIQETLLEKYPADTQLRDQLATTHYRTGIAFADAGRLADAIPSYQISARHFQRLAEINPSVSHYRFQAAYCYQNMGICQRRLGLLEDAPQSLETALVIRQKLAADGPSFVYLQMDVADTLNELGELAFASQRQSDAIRHFRNAQTILISQRKLHPKNRVLLDKLASSYFIEGSNYSDVGDSESSRKAFEAALPLWEQLFAEDSASATYASNLGGLLNNLALLDLQGRRFLIARDRLQQAISLQKQALAADPNHPVYQTYFRNHISNLLKVAEGLEDTELMATAEQELAEWYANSESVQARDAKLARVLNGTEPPGDLSQRLELALHAYETKRFRVAVELFSGIIEAFPKSVENHQLQLRYNAACCALRAISQESTVEVPLDSDTRAQLRAQALAWLQTELASWSALVKSDSEEMKVLVSKTLQHWQKDPDLESIRSSQMLEQLSSTEQDDFRRLWESVAALKERSQK